MSRNGHFWLVAHNFCGREDRYHARVSLSLLYCSLSSMANNNWSVQVQLNMRRNRRIECRSGFALAPLALTSLCAWGLDANLPSRQIHQAPDRDGVYYAGPEVTAPRLISTLLALYSDDVLGKDAQGMTVLAVLIGASGVPSNIHLGGHPIRP